MTDPIRDALTHLIREIDLLAAASEGVSGLDMNGGLEPWSSLLEGGKSSIWLGDAIAAGRAALAAQPPAPAADTQQLQQIAHAASDYLCGERFPAFAEEHGGLNLLKAQLARLLAHFEHGPRPVPGVDVPGPDGDYGGLQELCDAEGVDVRIGTPLLRRARDAWKVAAQPPAPASTTPDLGALLSPEGAYEGGTGQEDGAQLVSGPHGPEWWAPLYGCDTLDNLLHQLRARILPHLRPPVAGIDVPGPDGYCGDVIDLCAAEGVDYRVGVPLLKRARQAWRQTGRLHALNQEVHRFREPERTILCDILANGGLLPDPEGKRYGMPAPAPASDGEREELAPAKLLPTRYIHLPSGVTIERTRTDPDAWAVRRGSERMSVWGEWSIEPSPSERFDDYLAKHSFSGPHAALEVLPQPPQGGEVQP